MNDTLTEFLTQLPQDAKLYRAFLDDPDRAMRSRGVPAAGRRALLAGNPEEVPGRRSTTLRAAKPGPAKPLVAPPKPLIASPTKTKPLVAPPAKPKPLIATPTRTKPLIATPTKTAPLVAPPKKPAKK